MAKEPTDDSAVTKGKEIRRELRSSVKPSNEDAERVNAMKQMLRAIEHGDESAFEEILQRLPNSVEDKIRFRRTFSELARRRFGR